MENRKNTENIENIENMQKGVPNVTYIMVWARIDQQTLRTQWFGRTWHYVRRGFGYHGPPHSTYTVDWLAMDAQTIVYVTWWGMCAHIVVYVHFGDPWVPKPLCM